MHVALLLRLRSDVGGHRVFPRVNENHHVIHRYTKTPTHMSLPATWWLLFTMWLVKARVKDHHHVAGKDKGIGRPV
jgi:hypothetical protein